MMPDPLLKTKMALIENLQLTEKELATLIDYDDKSLRIDLLAGIFNGIYMSVPPVSDAVVHFFAAPNSVDMFQGKSAKQFLLDDPTVENMDRTYRYYMSQAV